MPKREGLCRCDESTGLSGKKRWFRASHALAPLRTDGSSVPPFARSFPGCECGRQLLREEGPAAGVPSWTIGLVREWIAEVFKVALSMESIRALMHSLGFRKLSPRPVHPKANPQKQEGFRKDF